MELLKMNWVNSSKVAFLKLMRSTSHNVSPDPLGVGAAMIFDNAQNVFILAYGAIGSMQQL